MTDPTDTLLAERGKTHGDFADHARVAQSIKSMYARKGLTAIQREALDMIAHKIGRIVAGDPNHADHWEDIAGYARLAVRGGITLDQARTHIRQKPDWRSHPCPDPGQEPLSEDDKRVRVEWGSPT